MIQVIHIISNKDNSGGTVAALNLHHALKQKGIESAVLSSGALEGFINAGGYRKFGGVVGRLQQAFIRLENLMARPGWINPLDKLVSPNILNNYSGVVHIHVTHIAQISFSLLAKLAYKNKVVWTLHDLWPLTGKCIHPMSCNKYLSNCNDCPKLTEYPKLNWDNTTFLHDAKRAFIKQHKIHFISPSKWIEIETGEYIRNLEGNIDAIPHGIDSTIFRPLDKSSIRLKYHIPEDGDLVLFPQGRWDDPKKGSEWYAQIRKTLTESDLLNRKIYLIKLMGHSVSMSEINEFVSELSLPVAHSKEIMAEYYNLADVTLSLSEIETFGLCIAESLACHTPVMARSAKGVNELLNEEVIASSPFALAGFIIEKKWQSLNYKTLYHQSEDKLSINTWVASHLAIYGL